MARTTYSREDREHAALIWFGSSGQWERISEFTCKPKKAPRGKSFQKGGDTRQKQRTTGTGDETVKSTTQEHEAGDRCPKCGTGDLVLKHGQYGDFLGCSRFPACRFTRKVVGKPEPEVAGAFDGEVKSAPATEREAEELIGKGQAKGKGQEAGQDGGEGEGEGEEQQGEGGEGKGQSQQQEDPITQRIRELAREEALKLDEKVLEVVGEELQALAKGGLQGRQQDERQAREELKAREVKPLATDKHPLFDKVVAKVKRGHHVIAIGPAGCGKTHLFGQVAEALGLRYGSLSCTAGMSESQITGRLLPMGEEGVFLSTEFVDIYEGGGLFLFDEVDAADPNVLLVINQALANGYLPLPNRIKNPRAKKHPHCVIAFAANTFGRGADRLYVGRNQLDAATLDRFAVVLMDYDRALEARLVPDKALLAKWWGIRERAASLKLRVVVSTRKLIAAYVDVQAGDSIDTAVSEALMGWSNEERTKVGLPAVQ